MKVNKKTVNIYASSATRIDGMLFNGNINGMELNTETIRKCLLCGIRVTEFIDGKLIPLGFDNFDEANPIAKEIKQEQEKDSSYRVISYDKNGNRITKHTTPTPTPIVVRQEKKEEHNKQQQLQKKK